MESHKCKLSSTLFPNGRDLARQMKAHFATAAAPPLPPSSSAAADYFIFPDHVSDRDSETEPKYPTRKRSKRCRQPANSVSQTSPEEDLATCLMMLSRDRWIQNQNQIPNQKLDEIKVKKKCERCRKQFRSYRALFSHEKICQLKTEQGQTLRNGGIKRRIFKCPFCLKIFGSGQALGGHKRSHLVSSANGGVTVNGSVALKLEICLIDLNLPAPLEEDHYSVVSDA